MKSLNLFIDSFSSSRVYIFVENLRANSSKIPVSPFKCYSNCGKISSICLIFASNNSIFWFFFYLFGDGDPSCLNFLSGIS